MFLDEAVVEFVSGRGGAGSATFHREKHVPRGGPNGADGGRGGDVVLVADRGRRTLYDFKLQQKFEAGNGSDAVGNRRGKDGESVEVRVPVGTIVTDADTGDVLIDLNHDGMRYMICKGGKGGFGNVHYTSSVRQAPAFAGKGAPADSVRAKLELKLLADIGLIGVPNAGKSTLISRISAAKPKIADYPFTTITPNLGVVQYGDTSFTAADMPGLIEGASEGRGLGHQFLKHVERTRVLVHVIDAFPFDESKPLDNYAMVEKELRDYSEDIFARPRIIAVNKIDLLPTDELQVLLESFKSTGHPVFAVSAVTGAGIDELLAEMARTLEREDARPAIPVVAPAMRAAEDLSWDVVETEDGFKVVGKRIERMVAMTNLGNEEAVRYLHRRLQRLGVIEKLREMGAAEGDTVQISELQFSFADEI